MKDNDSNEENLNNGIIFEEQESNEFLSNIIEQNLDKITKCSNIMNYSEIISIFSFLIFLIILCIKLSSSFSFSWLFLNIPGIFTIIGIISIFNCFFYIKDLIDKCENIDNNSIQIGNFFSFIISNIIGISLLTFLILVTLRLNNNIKSETDLNLIFTPLYIMLCASFLFSIFMSPAFISNNLYFEIILIFVNLISGFIFSGLLCYKINNLNSLNNNKIKFFHCFIPFYFCIGANIFFIIFIIISKYFKNMDFKLLSNFMYIFAFIFLFIGGLITQLKQDNIMTNKNNFIQIILFIISFLLFSLELIYNILINEGTEEMNESE